MSVDRNLTTTSISIPCSLLERAKVQAALSYRTFSQYVSFLIDQDLNRNGSPTALVSDDDREVSVKQLEPL
jgi:hypothetical protein